MEYSKTILEILLQDPGKTLDRSALRAAVIKEAAGAKPATIRRAFNNSLDNFRRQGIITCDYRTVTLADAVNAGHRLAYYNQPTGAVGGSCPEPGCGRKARIAGHCFPHADAKHAAGELTVDGKGYPLPTCKREDCGRLHHRNKLCHLHWCESQGMTPRLPRNVMSAEYYDWVVVKRHWDGQAVDRDLSSAEKVEIVRLTLRATARGQASSWWAVAQKMGMKLETLEQWIVRYRARAEKIGLDSQLRFCFLPDAELVADGVDEAGFVDEEQVAA